MAIASWSLVRVYGTWADAKGNMLSGTYKISVPARLTNSTDDLIIPAGTYDSGALNTTPGLPSLSVLCPSTDDPDIQQDGWKLTVEITLNGGRAPEKYILDVPIANRPVEDGGNGLGVNLRTIALTSQLPPQVAMYGVGVAGGLAILSDDGTSVLDADGDPMSASNLTGLDAAVAAKVADGASAVRASLSSTFGRIFSPMAYGATGDGIADDTEAIQAALDDAVATDGGLLALPPGIFRTTAPITWTNPTPGIVSGPRITGAGRSRTTILADFDNGSVIDIMGCAPAPGSLLAFGYGGGIEHLRITQTVGRVGIVGIR